MLLVVQQQEEDLLKKSPCVMIDTNWRGVDFQFFLSKSNFCKSARDFVHICERGLRSYSETAAQITREINFLSAATQKIRSKFRLFEKSFHALKKIGSETRT